MSLIIFVFFPHALVPKSLFDGRLLEASTSRATNSLNNRVHVSVSDMNLFAVNVDRLIDDDVEGVYNGDYIIAAVMNTNCELSKGGVSTNEGGEAVERGYLGKPILHDTCFLLDLIKTSGEGDGDYDNKEEEVKAASRESALSGAKTSSGTFHVNGEIIGPLKVVLSKDIYEQILQTLDNLVYDDYEERMMRGMTGGAPTTAATNEASDAKPKSSDAANKSDDFGAGAYDLSLGQNANDVVKIDFKLPILQVEIKGNFGTEGVSHWWLCHCHVCLHVILPVDLRVILSVVLPVTLRVLSPVVLLIVLRVILLKVL